MQARGPLMTEHRLIEQMLSVINNALVQVQTLNKVDPVFIDTAVDFIRVYADRTHHGKEEDILFLRLKDKLLSTRDRQIMHELIEEHVFGRETTKAIVAANSRYRKGDESGLAEIVGRLRTLLEFYPRHIEKEDKIFFPSVRGYFNEEEEQLMLREFWEFDRKLIHEKYKTVVDDLRGGVRVRQF